MRIRVLSWNIHKGFTPFNRQFVLRPVRDLIRATQADLVFLQEVQGEHRQRQAKVANWPSSTQFEFLADEVWHHYAYGRNAVYTEGHHGNAILSKFPIVSWENINLTLHNLEQRGLLHARIEIPKKKVEFDAYCTHLNLRHGDRVKQCHVIEKKLKARNPDSPMVMAGDFNDWNDELQRYLEKGLGLQEAFRTHRGRLARTFPAGFPIMPLDRVYFQGWKVLSSTRLDPPPGSLLSDHLPLQVELEWIT